MAYQITDFNRTTGEISFFNPINSRSRYINCHQYNDYRRVNPRHYYNAEHNEVILVQEGMTSFRPFVTPTPLPPTIEDQGRTYYPCEQWQFDKWNAKEHPDSHNAMIYHILVKELELIT